MEIIADNLQKWVDRDKVKPEEKDSALARIKCVTSIEEAAGDVDLVIEAVPEILGLKLDFLPN